jgi:taurine dioxygenase
MKLSNIHDSWGTRVEFDNPTDFFSSEIDWRKMLYERQALVFKRMKFSKEDYVRFGNSFGALWKDKDSYLSKNEVIIEVDGYPLSAFSNLYHPRLGNGGMKWHADLPNEYGNPFPIRSIWMTQNPNPAAGRTGFLNVMEFESLPDKLKRLLDRTEVVQQRWQRHADNTFTEGRELQRFPLVKVHPITGKRSLRINSYNRPGITDEWICKVYVDGIEQLDCSLIKEYTDALIANPDLLYWHDWDEFDILIYDNWSLIHCRTELKLKPGEERMLIRANIDHVPDKYWPTEQ